MRFPRRMRRGSGLLGQRGQLQNAAGSPFEHVDRLLLIAGVELDQQVDDDLVLLVLVKTNVGEKLTGSAVPKGAVGERVRGLRARTGLDLFLVDPHSARGDERLTGHHALPAILNRHDAPFVDGQVRLVVHAVEALHDGLLDLVNALGRLAGLRVDAQQRVIVDLSFQSLGPAAVAAKPGGPITFEVLVHDSQASGAENEIRTSSGRLPGACWMLGKRPSRVARTTPTSEGMLMRRVLLTSGACLVIGLSALAVGCGDDDEGDASTTAAETTAPSDTSTTDEGGASADAGATEIAVSEVSGNQFDPADVDAAPGDKVVWTNDDSIAHNVIADNGQFESETMEPGATFEWTAEGEGGEQISYVCTFHPGMDGTVTIDEASG